MPTIAVFKSLTSEGDPAKLCSALLIFFHAVVIEKLITCPWESGSILIGVPFIQWLSIPTFTEVEVLV